MINEPGRLVSLLTIPEYSRKWKLPLEVIERLVKIRLFPVQLLIEGKPYLDPDLRPNICSLSTYCKIWGVTRWSVNSWVLKGLLSPSLEDSKWLGKRLGKNYYDPFRKPPVSRKSKNFKKATKGMNV